MPFQSLDLLILELFFLWHLNSLVCLADIVYRSEFLFWTSSLSILTLISFLGSGNDKGSPWSNTFVKGLKGSEMVDGMELSEDVVTDDDGLSETDEESDVRLNCQSISEASVITRYSQLTYITTFALYFSIYSIQI